MKIKDKDEITLILNRNTVSYFLNMKYLGDAFTSEEFSNLEDQIGVCVHLDKNDQISVLTGYAGPEVKY